MKLLVDTQALLFWFYSPERLSRRAKTAVASNSAMFFFSLASFWEICIKVGLGKLELSAQGVPHIQRELAYNRIEWLPISSTHCERILDMPFHHRDPFDRILIAQARVEKLAILSSHKTFDAYDVERVW